MSDEGRVSGLRELGESAMNTVLDRVGRGVGKVQERRPLAYDLLESDEAYLVVFDTPGVTNTDVQVQFREGAIEVQVDRFRDFYEGVEMRFPGRGLSLDGRAELPADAAVDPRTAEATLTEHGTLEVRVPKNDDAVTLGEHDAEADDDSEPIQLDPDGDAETETETENDEADAGSETHGDTDGPTGTDEAHGDTDGPTDTDEAVDAEETSDADDTADTDDGTDERTN